MRKGFKKALSFVLSAAMLVSLGSGLDISTAGAETTENGTGTETAATATGGAFKASLSFEVSGTYDYRHPYEGLDAEKKYNEWAAKNNIVIPNYNGLNIYYNGNGASLKKDGTLKKPEKVEPCLDASVVDEKMKADGEYTIAIKNLKLDKAAEQGEVFNMLKVATNIPMDEANKDAKITATSVKIAGKEIGKDAVLPVKGDIKAGSYYQFMIANQYAPDDGTNPLPLYYSAGSGDYSKSLAVPSGAFDIEVTFKIEGVDWTTAPAEDAEPTPAPTQVPTTAPVVTPPPVVDLKTSFDMYLSANVNDGLTPETATELVSPTTGKKLQSASWGSEEMKAKVFAAKSTNKTNGKVTDAFDQKESYYVVNPESSATISKTGEYSLSVVAAGNSEDITGNGAIWFPIMINGSISNMPTDFNIVGKSVTVGDKSYAWNSHLLQDSQGSVRLVVCNQWATEDEKADNNTIAEAIPVKQGDKITFNFYVTADAPAPAKTATPVAIGPSTSYNAYLGFQTDDWLFRDPWNNSETGLKCKDYDYLKQVAWNHGGKTNPINVTSITDAKMEKNGVKYNLSIKGLDVKKVSSASTKFNMLFITTDIPLSMKGVQVKNAVLKIDGKKIKEYKVVPNKADASKYYQFMLADAYAPDDGTKDAPYPKGAELKTFPTDSIEVEYTVSGVDFNSKVIGVKKGKTFTQGNFKYKVTKAVVLSGDNKVTKGAVQVVGLSKKGKKKASLSLGATAKVTSKAAISTAAAVMTYKVTTLKSGAFKNSAKLKSFSFKKATNVKKLPSKVFMNCKKLKKVELNKKMKKIPAAAFKGCKNLATIKCNAKLSSVSKSAFKGCKKKIKITGKSKKANKKKIKKAYKKVK